MHLLSKPKRSLPGHWDAYEGWRRLLREYPLKIEDPAGSTGRMDRRHAKLFWISVAEYPDPLQDVLFVIAHARGFEAALAALDQAIRAQTAPHRGRHAPSSCPPEPRAPHARWLSRAAS